MRQVPDHRAKIQADPSRSKRCRPVHSPAKAETIDVCCLLCELAAKLGSLGESVESIESVVRTSWNAKIMKTRSESTHDATWRVHAKVERNWGEHYRWVLHWISLYECNYIYSTLNIGESCTGEFCFVLYIVKSQYAFFCSRIPMCIHICIVSDSIVIQYSDVIWCVFSRPHGTDLGAEAALAWSPDAVVERCRGEQQQRGGIESN